MYLHHSDSGLETSSVDTVLASLLTHISRSYSASAVVFTASCFTCLHRWHWHKHFGFKTSADCQTRCCCVEVSECWAVLTALAGVRGCVAVVHVSTQPEFLNQYDHPLASKLWAPCFTSPPPHPPCTSAMLHGVRSHAMFDPFIGTMVLC